jgi:hypothetical protein
MHELVVRYGTTIDLDGRDYAPTANQQVKPMSDIDKSVMLDDRATVGGDDHFRPADSEEPGLRKPRRRRRTPERDDLPTTGPDGTDQLDVLQYRSDGTVRYERVTPRLLEKDIWRWELLARLISHRTGQSISPVGAWSAFCRAADLGTLPTVDGVWIGKLDDPEVVDLVAELAQGDASGRTDSHRDRRTRAAPGQSQECHLEPLQGAIWFHLHSWASERGSSRGKLGNASDGPLRE